MSKPRKIPSPRARSLASLGLFFAVGVVTVTGVRLQDRSGWWDFVKMYDGNGSPSAHID